MRKYILNIICILIYGMNTTSCTDSYQQMLQQTLEQFFVIQLIIIDLKDSI